MIDKKEEIAYSTEKVKKNHSWHNLEKKEIFEILKTSHEGISHEEAARRLEIHGKNEIKKISEKSILRIFLNQFKSVFIIILLVASLFSIVIKHYLDAILILIIVLINAFIGFFQEYKAEKIIFELKKLLVPKVKVIRENKIEEISSDELVPGDILIISEGDKITGDSRIIESNNLLLNESVLTGESFPQEKISELLKKDLILTERKNMVYSGTHVVGGNGKGIVINTGMNTEFGKIAEEIQKIKEEESPLQKKINELSKIISITVLGISFILVLFGIFQKRDFFELILTSISLAISVIPEGLPAVISIILALTIKRMQKQKALVKKLSSAETLGRTTVICTDKTGTLTEEKISVVKVYYNNKEVDVDKNVLLINNKKINFDKEETLKKLIETGILCNSAEEQIKDKEMKVFGDPTEEALIRISYNFGIKKKELTEKYPKIKEYAFSSDRKMMSIIRKVNDNYVCYSKGAPDILLKRCSKEMINGKIKVLNEKRRKELIREYQKLSSEALRVLAFAFKIVPKNFSQGYSENNLIFLGFQGMIDKPREEIKKAIEECKKAGIKIKMITGDSELTAKAIARMIGLDDNSIDGIKLENLSDKEFSKIVEEKTIFARITPEIKFRIIKCLKNKEEIVAVTGDGVNDILAIKEADIGIAMGIRGTEITRDVSDIVLLDDNFKTIVQAIKEGRRSYENLKKSIKASLSANVGELFFLIITMIFNLPLPFLPLSILWMNLITDSMPILSLGFEKEEKGIMEKKPSDFNENIMNKIFSFVIISGILSTLIAFLFFIMYYESNLDKARTLVLTSLIFSEAFIILSCRSDDKNIKEIKGFFSNKILSYSLLIMFILQIIAVYTPLSKVLGLTSISIIELLILFLSSSSIFIIFEISKFLKKKKLNK
ncbi:cation-transporting P-type ATPase [Candidatus Woesearchaeota archaeon]|nr:cation-transporting P-type ATPase [Candidatus Woesearchaeota archaeon]